MIDNTLGFAVEMVYISICVKNHNHLITCSSCAIGSASASTVKSTPNIGVDE